MRLKAERTLADPPWTMDHISVCPPHCWNTRDTSAQVVEGFLANAPEGDGYIRGAILQPQMQMTNNGHGRG